MIRLALGTLVQWIVTPPRGGRRKHARQESRTAREQIESAQAKRARRARRL